MLDLVDRLQDGGCNIKKLEQAIWDADFYVKVDDDVHLNLGNQRLKVPKVVQIKRKRRILKQRSKFKRLDFHGFYLVALLKDQEVTCAATARIHGHKVVEMPLIATPFKYRRKGMCRLLVHELEKMLIDLGIKRLVLPTIPQLSETWVSSFDFKEMPDELMQKLCGFPFLIFQGTKLFQKVLSKSSLVSYSSCSLQEAERTKPGVTPGSR